MKWLIWSQPSRSSSPLSPSLGGSPSFGLPLLALGYLVLAVIAHGGSAEHR